MAAISMTGSNVYAGAELWGHVRADGIVFTVEMTKVGTVRRIESTGPRGGKRTVWEARVWRHLSEFVGDFSTRTGAVRALVAALEGERAVESAPVESCPVDAIPAPDTCGTCLGVDGDCVCEPVESDDETPSHSYAGSVSHEVLSVDVQRHAAYLDAPASVVARVRVRYSFSDAPARVHGFLFSFNEGEPWSVRMVSTVPSGTGLVTVYDPARFGSFSDDPVSWVHAFYA